ncbi:hypothetical protein [Pseudomonas sp. CF161]|uniref:hypothetical protein n=1 Tax=Pseudomonas sp. CF161 TaxID=911241 RepID=UPI0012EC34FC|nr:hypothetical protein [Pseudomonas sp. CF161]
MPILTLWPWRIEQGTLAFWEDVVKEVLALGKVHYHFHPLRFIEVFKRCGWLSPAELRHMVPARALRGVGVGISAQIVYEDMQPRAGRLVAALKTELNRTLRKFIINTPARMAAFLGNAVQEPAWSAVAFEEYAGNRWYAPWFGRGFLQLTHPSNYLGYWHWRGRTITPAVVHGLRQAQRQPGQNFTFYENKFFRRVSCLINLPGHINGTDPQLNGLVDRYYAYAYAQVLLLDHPVFPDASGKLVFLPDGYQLRGEIPR